VEDPDVCAGSVALEGPIVAQQLRQMKIGSTTSKVFLSTFLGVCAYPSVDTYTVPFPSPKPAGNRRVPGTKTPLKVVQYSDIHIDQFYVPGSSTNCTKPICCRDYTAASFPGNNSSPAGPNGDHRCDAPISLETSMYNAIKKLVPDAAFAIFTGDIIDHAVWNTTQSQNIIDINDAYNRMSTLGIPIYGVVGNHEASPTNAFPAADLKITTEQWIYNTLSTDWTPWIGVSAAASEKSFGAFSVIYSNTNLKVISINTNFYYIDNYWAYTDPQEKDPSGQLAWLVQQLQASETANQNVYIIGHTPMGSSDAFHDGSNYFDQIVNRYSNTISGMFFGHTHVDQFEVSYSNYNNRSASTASAMSYICPSMTPTSGHPSFRVYLVDPDTFQVLDSITYFADMTNPAYQTTGPVWTEYYSARTVYGPLVSPPLPAGAELSPAFWHNVTTAFQSNPAAFNSYYARRSRGWNVPACTGTCESQEICQLQAGRSENNCFTPSAGVNFGKRDVSSHADHHDNCGASVLKEVLHKRK
jgi:sphingomyelin phosphodiesterase